MQRIILCINQSTTFLPVFGFGRNINVSHNSDSYSHLEGQIKHEHLMNIYILPKQKCMDSKHNFGLRGYDNDTWEVKISLRQREQNFCVPTPSFLVFFLSSYLFYR